MGHDVIANCECGFEGHSLIGCGMMHCEPRINNRGLVEYINFCCFPVLCRQCHTFQEANLGVKTLRCKKCNSRKVLVYDHPDLCARKGPQIVSDWNPQGLEGHTLVLTDGDYLCPKCGKFTLHFMDGGMMWD